MDNNSLIKKEFNKGNNQTMIKMILKMKYSFKNILLIQYNF
jgi:hypothetical protein